MLRKLQQRCLITLKVNNIMFRLPAYDDPIDKIILPPPPPPSNIPNAVKLQAPDAKLETQINTAWNTNTLTTTKSTQQSKTIYDDSKHAMGSNNTNNVAARNNNNKTPSNAMSSNATSMINNTNANYNINNWNLQSNNTKSPMQLNNVSWGMSKISNDSLMFGGDSLNEKNNLLLSTNKSNSNTGLMPINRPLLQPTNSRANIDNASGSGALSPQDIIDFLS